MFKPHCNDMSYDEISAHKDLRFSQIRNNERDVKRVNEAISGFANPFCSDVNADELYCLSSGVPAKPDVANDLLQAPGIDQKSMKDFIKSRLVERSVGFHEPIKRNKLNTLQPVKSQRMLTSLQNKMGRVKRICVFEHSVMTNFNCACPAIQRGQGSGFLSEGSS